MKKPVKEVREDLDADDMKKKPKKKKAAGLRAQPLVPSKKFRFRDTDQP